MRTLFNEWLLHFFVGGGFGFFAVVLFRYFGRRRPIFRFGGDDPVSIGDKSKWLLWYVTVCAFELGTSFFTNRLYLEFALSIFQATGGTIALFLVDRIAMMFEPQSYWMPKQVDHLVSPVITIPPEGKAPKRINEERASARMVPEENETVGANHKKDGRPLSFAEAELIDDLDVRPDVSWFGERVYVAQERTQSGWRNLLKMVHEGFRYRRTPKKYVRPINALPARSEASNPDEEIKRAKEEQMRKFSESIKGF